MIKRFPIESLPISNLNGSLDECIGKLQKIKEDFEDDYLCIRTVFNPDDYTLDIYGLYHPKSLRV